MIIQRLTFTIKDAKGQVADVVLYFPAAVDVIHLFQVGVDFALLLMPLTTGQITQMTYSNTLDTDLTDPAEDISDVEEKAKIWFQSAYPDRSYVQTIPAIDENRTYPVLKKEMLDLTDPTVAAWITAMIDGVFLEGPDLSIHPSDSRGNDIAEMFDTEIIYRRRKQKRKRLF